MKNKYKQFRFETYNFDYTSGVLSLKYSHDGERFYNETIKFELPKDVDSLNKDIIDSLCFYVFIIAGTSYYKSFIAPEMVLIDGQMDYWQADFFNMIYRGGLSQFIFENKLNPDQIAKFDGSEGAAHSPRDYEGAGVLLMQSGGKDSLLAGQLLKESKNDFTSWHMSSTGKYPPVLDMVGKKPVVVTKRSLDYAAIKEDWQNGGLNGHIPFSALYSGFALIQAVLHGDNLVVASNESSADQANTTVDGFSVNHQFTKTYLVEQAISEYLERYVSHELHYGSILRPLNELQVAQLFAKKAWPKYGHLYSSCNLANYKQGEDDGQLSWDGTCPKCANTFVLLAPFVDKQDLLDIFDGKNLLQDEDLTETYKQLFGLSDVKPLECVGTFEELQQAYNLAVKKDADFKNPDIETTDDITGLDGLGRYQDFFDEFIDYKKLV